MCGLLSLWILSACALQNGDDSNPIRPGKTTEADLRELRGTPKTIENVTVSENGKIFCYERDERFQLEGGVVIAHFRAPERGAESTLQHWLQQWRGKRVEERALTREDTPGLREFLVQEDGIAVWYDSARDRVARVVRFRAHSEAKR